jgi:hypothetical protein
MTETYFYWQMGDGRQVYAGDLDGLKDGYWAGGNPAAIERSLCYLFVDGRIRWPVAELLYLVLIRPDGAQKLVSGDPPDEKLLNRPPTALDRIPMVEERWPRLSESRRRRELLLLHFHDVIKTMPEGEDRNGRLRVLSRLMADLTVD